MTKHPIKRLYQSVLLISIAGIFITLATANMVIINTNDFSIYNTGWNGCSRFALQAESHTTLQQTITLNQTDYTPMQQSFAHYHMDPHHATIIIIGPQTLFSDDEIRYIDEFVQHGGCLFLTDDFGTSNSLLNGLQTESRFSNQLMLDLTFEKNASFAVIHTFHHKTHPLTSNISSLLLNYPSSLNPSPNATILASSSAISWLDGNLNRKEDLSEPHGPFPIITSEPYGKGTIILCSAPSVLINSMESYASNQQFRTILLQYLCENKHQVLIDESHRGMIVPFTLTYQFTSDLPLFLKISILLLAIIIFLSIYTPLPTTMMQTIQQLTNKTPLTTEPVNPSTIIEEVGKKHPSWNKTKIKHLVERMNSK